MRRAAAPCAPHMDTGCTRSISSHPRRSFSESPMYQTDLLPAHRPGLHSSRPEAAGSLCQNPMVPLLRALTPQWWREPGCHPLPSITGSLYSSKSLSASQASAGLPDPSPGAQLLKHNMTAMCFVKCTLGAAGLLPPRDQAVGVGMPEASL